MIRHDGANFGLETLDLGHPLKQLLSPFLICLSHSIFFIIGIATFAAYLDEKRVQLQWPIVSSLFSFSLVLKHHLVHISVSGEYQILQVRAFLLLGLPLPQDLKDVLDV